MEKDHAGSQGLQPSAVLREEKKKVKKWGFLVHTMKA